MIASLPLFIYHASQRIAVWYRSLSPVLSATRAIRAKYGVLVLFQPRDCEGYRDFMDAVAVLGRTADMPVVGVPLNMPESRSAFQAAVQRLDPPFPLAPAAGDATSEALWLMGYRHTPVALVVDPAGRPVAVLPPEPVPYHQAREMEALRSYLDTRRNGSLFR